ncbi:MAG: hypothetical protein GFH27_549303n176 [Chloroflexi bacterium AL-W]|nr:hypothetical protein [Chloroflexi bacterium AL-N1]NOK68061.1 hypothetical protein [Chloroflexi bacterium AL-N10]NOK73401.1 hypothetical protein [Chloroflexi bacterium AL-N5]NOK83315.1 hypothetical protein [Chloroflexi bacterium AL-W]NOK87732.1 hypothetical protein [Chloroflexi bacterium AL-N15]
MSSEPIPNYWLSCPDIEFTLDITDDCEAFYHRWLVNGDGAWFPDTLPLPKWVFCSWLADYKQLLLHGSGDPNITEFQPRTPQDRSPDSFSKQTAVFAASDGIWPIFYAVLNRMEVQCTMLNGALQFATGPNQWSTMRYFFSLTESALHQYPWREGILYVLPREDFMRQPPYKLGLHMVYEPHWACLTSVRPLAKIRVAPTDFPWRDQIRGHNDEYIRDRAAADPYGFPWLDDT